MCDTHTKRLSTVAIAKSMGVGESSVKRWIDSGTLAAEKTPGGHRRVAVSDLYKFLHATGKKLVNPESLGLLTLSKEDGKNPLEICINSLQFGDAFTFESTLQLLRLSEPTAAVIMDKTVYPAFQAVRESCRHPSEECMVLHRAISIVQSALRVTMEPTDSNLDEASPRIVLADIGYEVDALPTLLAEAAIANRTHCLQLGMNVPAKVIAGAIDSFDADVLWLSASGPCRRSKVLQDFETLLTRAKHKHVKVVVFGDALPLKLEKSVTRLTSFGEFRGFIAALGKSQRTNL